MVIVIPKHLKNPDAVHHHVNPDDIKNPGFVIHPPTSELARTLQIDPNALANENYSGIYDEAGDYIPQYCDDPNDIPQGAMIANVEKNTSASAAGTESNSDTGNDNSTTDDK